MGQLAYLPQRFGLLSELSVRENVEYPARLAGGSRDRRERSTSSSRRSASTSSPAARRTRRRSASSSGPPSPARSSLQPPVLLADEPSSHQDAGFRDRVWEQIGAAAAAGTACLIATHEDEAAGYASRLWRITDGTASRA